MGVLPDRKRRRKRRAKRRRTRWRGNRTIGKNKQAKVKEDGE